MKMMLFAALALLAVPCEGFASPAKDIRDMAVYCTNGLTCEISLLAKTGGKLIYSLSLSRAAGPDTPVLIKIRASAPMLPTGELVFSADGKPVMAVKAADFDFNADFEEYTSKAPAAGFELFGLIRNASVLTLRYAAVKPGTADFSLAGLSGAGLYLDEVQGRLDSTDALVKIGGKTTAPPPVRDISAFEQLPAVLRPDFEGQEGACGFYDQSHFTRGSGFQVTLPDDVALYVLPCTDGGAYNQPYALYQISSGAVSEVALPTMTEDGPSTTTGATNVDWDQPTLTLTAFDKGRGLGDCGTYDKWKLRDVPGEASFALVESREMDECNGEGGGGPETWPLLWPKR
jgi:hypothetical protein